MTNPKWKTLIHQTPDKKPHDQNQNRQAELEDESLPAKREKQFEFHDFSFLGLRSWILVWMFSQILDFKSPRADDKNCYLLESLVESVLIQVLIEREWGGGGKIEGMKTLRRMLGSNLYSQKKASWNNVRDVEL